MDIESHDQVWHLRKKLSRRLLDLAFPLINEGIVVVGPTQTILATNDAFTSITGFTEEECIGRTWDFLQGPNTDLKTVEEIRNAYQDEIPFLGEIENYRKDGAIFWNDLTIKPLFDKSGKLLFFIELINDISRLKAIEVQLKSLAFIDPLTKLFTRRLLEDRLGQVLLKTSRSNEYAALFFIDLDNFKRINDLFGHAAGDIRLQDVAKRLKEIIREEDTVARIGGDEFVILVNELSPDISIAKSNVKEKAKKIVEKLSTQSCLLDPIHKPCRVDGVGQCRCSASLGIVLFSGKDKSIEQLLAEADAAMYRAKAAGGNCYQFYEGDCYSRDEQNQE